MAPERKIRWGVLGTAKIAVEKVIPAMQKSEHCEVRALASRDQDKAAATARRLGIPTAHGTYEALLADPEIDAIYNPLPNHLHVPWSIRALEAGKHVLCEKPIGLDVAQAKELAAASARFPRLKLMEAFMYRHHPQWRAAKRLVDEGQIGRLVTIQTLFSYFNRDPNNVRNQFGIGRGGGGGGGGLMDIGCYPVSLSRFLFQREPARVWAHLEIDPDFRVDRLGSGVLDFGTGTSAFTYSTQMAPYQRVQIVGSDGRIEIEIPFNAPPDQPCRLWHQTSRGIEEVRFPVCDQYTIQGDLFAAAILNDTPVPTPIADAVANMIVLEALFASDRSGTWEAIAAASATGG